jgi:hypothetical protein
MNMGDLIDTYCGEKTPKHTADNIKSAFETIITSEAVRGPKGCIIMSGHNIQIYNGITQEDVSDDFIYENRELFIDQILYMLFG